MSTPLHSGAAAVSPRRGRSAGLLTSALLLLALLLGAAATTHAQAIFGLSGTELTSLSAAAPSAPPTRQAIVGVTAGQVLMGLDFRPATGELFALGYDPSTAGLNARLYVLSQNTSTPTATATPIGSTALRLELGGPAERIGFDFNPTVDRLRVVSTNDADYRLNPNNGAIVLMDGTLAYAGTDPNAGQNPFVGTAAYTNSTIGATSTTLYTIDEQRSLLLTQNPPNAGTLNTVATLSVATNGAGVSTDLDITTTGPNVNQAFLIVNTPSGGNFSATLYQLNLTTGAAIPVGNQTGSGVGITDIAISIDRTAPAASGQLLYAVSATSTLLSFYSGTPTFINSATPITGLTAGQTLVGTDFRPNNGQLIGLGYDATTAGANTQVYFIDRMTAVATAAGAAIRLELGGSTDNIGFDFNPTVDRLRVVSTNRNDYRLNPNNGALAFMDGTLTYAATDANSAATPRVGTAAYTNSYAGTTGTVLYDIDEALSNLVTQSPPNAGTLNTVGSTGLALNTSNALVDLDIYFDKTALTNTAYLTANPNGQNFSNLYTLNLTSGTPTLVGAIGQGIAVRDVAAFIAPLTQPALTGQLAYGVAGGNLISFDTGNPGNIRSAVNVTGLQGAQVVAGADFRPANGMLYVLGYDAAAQQGQIYTISLTTGALTNVSGALALALGADANAIGFDFNPAADAIRIVSATNQANFRYALASSTLFTDTPLTNPAGTPMIAGAAYANNDNNANTGTTLYGYDQARNVLLRSTNANGGTYVDQGASGIAVNTAQGVDLDIYSDLTDLTMPANSAFLAAAATGTTADFLYSISLTSGAASPIGRIGQGTNLAGFAIFLMQPPVITAGVITWTGAVSTAWAVAGNWLPMTVPTATDDVLIPDTPNDPVVSDPRQVNNLTLGSGATLTTADMSLLTLNGNFFNNGGTVLGAGNGEVRFAGAALQTISGTATQFQNLTTGPAGVALNAPTSVQRVLSLNNGTLTTNANLTLLSNAAGTAEVVNNGAGTASGTVTVQRYIDPTRNAGLGYRHYSAPVTGSTVADLTTPGFTPVVNPAYNTQGNTVTPFPTVFGYDESRVNTSGNPSPQDFDKGFFSPNTLGDALEVTRGYTVNIASTQTVDFTGTLNNGTYTTGSLSRGSQQESGFHLRGNPYPSPIDWDFVVRNNVDPTVYVYRSSGQYAGTYSTYTVNGTGTNGGERQIPVAQGFFVRAATNNADLTFNNTARITAYTNPVFQRGAITAPLVRLDLRNAAGAADEAVVYFDANATTGFDPALDAFKLLGGSPLALASTVGTSTILAVNGLPALATADVTVPLRVQATAGANTLRATELLRLPAGTYVYLQDALTGTAFDLSQPAGYAFTVGNAASLTGRFSLLITPQRVLGTATATAALARQVALYPNPAKSATFVELPATLGRTAVTASLVDALGRTVRTQALPAQGAAAHQLSLVGVANGIYTLQLATSAGLVVKKLVVE
ncbi:DUF4394 domain-containing protein [Hymenobacter sp. UYCo722]|uniref:DUF4394 domain-containing protein n=1 Tax=Hymenobacter sp. UYCo722 TaxID=3156335 RepID=UPI0033915DAC